MAAIQVTSTTPYTAWLMSSDLPPADPSVLDSWEMMLTIAQAGYVCNLRVYAPVNISGPDTSYGPSSFDLIISKDGYPDQSAPAGAYVVFDGTYATVITADTYTQKYQQTAS